jgi:ribosomal protein S5
LVADVDVEIASGDVDASIRAQRDVRAASGALKCERANSGIGISAGYSMQRVVTEAAVISAGG